jgi:hypothetical protein
MGHQLHLARLRSRRLRRSLRRPLRQVRSQVPRLLRADNYPGPLDYEGETNKLFHNNCDGTFTDVTENPASAQYVGRTMGVTAADFDNDGWDDIYVANDRTENFLFHNKHDGTFEEIGNDTGTAFGQNGESTSSMGPVFADFEGRGVLDLWVTDGHYNRFLLEYRKAELRRHRRVQRRLAGQRSIRELGHGHLRLRQRRPARHLIFHGGLIHLIPQEHTLFRGLAAASSPMSRARPAPC